MVKRHEGNIDPDQLTEHGALPSLLWERPPGEARATLILAHGAGAPMDSPFMTDMAQRLVARGMAVVRFEFDYMAQRRQGGRRPPDQQPQLLACWRTVLASVRQQVAGTLAVGGKSMGGRMASLLADEEQVDGLVCLGYPFHPAKRLDRPRVEHLADLATPTLIVQGERDALGSRETVAGYRLSGAIRLLWLPAADHDLKPLKASGFTHDDHLARTAEAVADFLLHLSPRPGKD
ncbi:alpha/beta family hydrolase [Pseudomonas mangiferae]|uniref:Alpha/beta hydrolase n=1 Tax=Pseudomonas mangiferae TaxID=2593654 RepID=A0A553GY04_9PSED|nr:alpha/beta family hydrolase [Pseudomonas mangiferae]TRX74366.1 alpha/beta hydrolase [Pseudomonas mangiferae]